MPGCDQDSAVLSDPGAVLPSCPWSVIPSLWSNCHGIQVAFSARIVPGSAGCAPKKCQVGLLRERKGRVMSVVSSSLQSPL